MRKKPIDPRTQIVKIRVSQQELDAMQERKPPEQPLASWMREVALNQRKIRKIPRCDPELLKEFNAIGVNLNQIARVLNTAKLAGEVIDLVSTLAILRSIEDRLTEQSRAG